MRRSASAIAKCVLVLASLLASGRCEAQRRPPASVHYLGGNSWAVRVGRRLLVFDYVQATGPASPDSGAGRGLARGSIGPADLDSLDVFVFVTHQHADHYDSVIYGWRRHARFIRYFFGWRAGSDPTHHYLVGPRAGVDVGGVRVRTVNSHQDGVPEVAYLVQVDGWTIYHNGDYRGEIREDFTYLRGFADRVDLAFLVSGWPREDHPLFRLARHFVEVFRPAQVFLIDRQGQERRTETFARFLAGHGAVAPYLHGDLPGDLFVVSADSLREHRRTR